jgi:hypothetical protein
MAKKAAMAVNAMPAFFTIVFIFSRIQISESAGYRQNENSDDVNRTDGQTDDNPSARSLIARFRLIIQILFH